MIGIGSMLITMRFAIHGREVVIPNFVGLTVQQAEQVAISNHLLLGRESSFYSSQVAQGHIVSQVPNAGVKVRRGWRVRIAESLGPQRIVIPSVLGQSPRAAELNLRRRGLELGTVATIPLPDEAPDEIVAQSPPPQAKDIASPKVSLLVAAPAEEKAYVMPDLSGMKLANASVEITDAGLKVGLVNTIKPDTTASNGTNQPAVPRAASGDPIIVKQTPAPGQRVNPGMTVSLDVVR